MEMLKCSKCGVVAENVENVRPKGENYVDICPKCLDEWVRKANNEEVVMKGLWG